MPGPEQQTEQTKEQKLDAAMQSITASINNIRQNEGKEDIHNINEMIDSEFLKNIDQWTASDIITIIDALWLKDKELPKDLKNLRDVLEPIAAQNIQGFWSLNNFTNAEPENLDNKQQKLVKEINSQISELTSQITDSSLKDILNQVNTIVTHLNNQNKEQLANFLTANWIDLQDQNDNTIILNWVNQFLEKIGQRIKDEKESTAVLNERAADAQQFWEFLKTIRALKWEDLDTYWYDRYLDKICTFIEHNPKNEDVIDAYIIMKQINLENESNIGSRDKTVFKDVFNTLNNLYWKKDWVEDNIYRQKAAQRYWDLKFYERDKKNISIVDIITTENGLNRQNWDGSSLQEDGDKKDQIQNLVNNMQGKSFDFDAKYFIENFNNRNDVRINNNANLLGKVDITTKIDLSKVTYDKENDELLLQKDWEASKPLTKDNLITELWITAETIWNVNWTNFVDWEMDNMILTDENVQDSWLKQIVEKKKAENPTDDWEWWNEADVEPETQINSLESENDIKISLIYWVKAEDIFGVLNGLDNTAKTENADRINEVIAALRNNEKIPGSSWNKSIRWLQEKMYTALQQEWKMTKKLVADWKFWPRTLYAMKLYLWAKITRWETLIYEKWGTLSGVQRQIAELIDTEGNDEALGNFGIVAGDWENINDVALNLLDKSNRRKYLETYISLFDFPGRSTIKDVINNKDDTEKLMSLQLHLIPYYKWHIDWQIGPLTLNAVEQYIKNQNNPKLSKNEWEADDDFSRRKKAERDKPIILEGDSQWTRKEVIDNSSNPPKLTAVITNNHAYFLNWDFDYSIDGNKIIMEDPKDNSKKYSLDGTTYDPDNMDQSYKDKLGVIKNNQP